MQEIEGAEPARDPWDAARVPRAWSNLRHRLAHCGAITNRSIDPATASGSSIIEKWLRASSRSTETRRLDSSPSLVLQVLR